MTHSFPFAVLPKRPTTQTPLFATAGEAWRHARLHGGRVVYLDRATPRCVPVATP